MSQFPYATTGYDLSMYNPDAQSQLPSHNPSYLPPGTIDPRSVNILYRDPSLAERQAGRPARVGHASSATAGHDGQGAEAPYFGELHSSCL